MTCTYSADLTRVVPFFSFFVFVLFLFFSFFFFLFFSLPLCSLPFLYSQYTSNLWNTTNAGAMQEFPGADSATRSACPGESSSPLKPGILGILFLAEISGWDNSAILRWACDVNLWNLLKWVTVIQIPLKLTSHKDTRITRNFLPYSCCIDCSNGFYLTYCRVSWTVR